VAVEKVEEVYFAQCLVGLNCGVCRTFGISIALQLLMQLTIMMTVYFDAVKLETEAYGRRRVLGWFRDEVSAIGAAAEHFLMDSAELSSLRKLPACLVSPTYIAANAQHDIIDFKRATRTKLVAEGRRVVRVPGTFGRVWI